MEKVYIANSNQNKAGMAKLKPDNVDFKTRIIAKGKEVSFKMIKGSIFQGYRIILNVHTQSFRIYEAKTERNERRN